MNEALALAVDAVYDAHDVPASRRIPIRGQFAAVPRANIVAESHRYHNGDWTLGSCDAELFALEWDIYLAEHPDREPSAWQRIREWFAPLDPQP
jgi:hypothetical protein